MTAHEKLVKFAAKHGSTLTPKAKVKVKKSDISTAAKQKDLIIQIAQDLGYLEKD
jgi:hypothetical protein